MDGASAIFSSILMIIVFGAIVFMAYIVTKFLAKKSSNAMKGKYINTVESIALGFDKHIHLLQVGDKYVLISSSGKNIQYMTTLNNEDIHEVEIEENQQTVFDFKSIFDKYVKKSKTDNTNKFKSETNIKETSAFETNLKKLRNVTKDKSDNGDENTNEK